MGIGETIEEMCGLISMVRSTLLQGASFRNQGVLTQQWPGPLVTRFQMTKSCPSEAFSILTMMSFDVDSK